jgi:tetratricopeptide (TPR) repeat protein
LGDAGGLRKSFSRKGPGYLEEEEFARGDRSRIRRFRQGPAVSLQWKNSGSSFHQRECSALISAGELKQAVREADAAIRITPGWAAPHNNRALALFFSGQIDRAIAEESTVLKTIDADNIHALGNLILFHASIWQSEQAAEYAGQLRELLESSPLEGLDLSKAIESLGVWENDEVLWGLAKRLIGSSPEALSGLSWYILGAAAANTGHVPEAKRLLARAEEQGSEYDRWIEPALDAVKKASRRKKPPVGPCLTGRFPYIHFHQVWPWPIADELMKIVSTGKGEEVVDPHLQKYLARYPYVAFAAKLILWCEPDENMRELSLDLLAAAGHPEAFNELRRFATSAVWQRPGEDGCAGQSSACMAS